MSPATAVMRVNRKLAVLVVIGMFVNLGVMAYVFVDSHRSKTALKRSERKARNALAASDQRVRIAIVKSQRRGCERGKLDRQDNADFQMAQKRYISKVVLAQSVKEDVKTAARQAIHTFDRTSASLSKRAKIDCRVAFPYPRTSR